MHKRQRTITTEGCKYNGIISLSMMIREMMEKMITVHIMVVPAINREGPVIIITVTLIMKL